MEVLNKTIHTVLVLFFAAIILIGVSADVNAATKNASGNKIFSATVPDIGIYVNWGVNFLISGTYSNSSVPYTLTDIQAAAYIDPKRVDEVGNGSITATITETIDNGSAVNRIISPVASSFWYYKAEIWPSSTYVYFSKYGNPSKSFYYSADEVGNYSFYYPDGAVHNPNYSLTLSISGPK